MTLFACVITGARAALAGPVLLQLPEAMRAVFPQQTYVPGELIVRYERPASRRVSLRRGAGSAGARAAGRGRGDVVARTRGRVHMRAHATSARRLPLVRTELLHLHRGASVTAAARRISALPGVAFAEPNYVRRALASVVPDDPEYPRMWNLHDTGQVSVMKNSAKNGDLSYPSTPGVDIGAPEAWAITTGSRDVIVGVLDSGILYDHPDLAANIYRNYGEIGGGKESNRIDDDHNGYADDWRGWDFNGGKRGRDDNDPLDRALHGTHVAGTIGAVGNNGIGTTGVAWNTQLMAVKVLDDTGYGTVEDTIRGYIYARRQGATVINGSFGGDERSLAEFATIQSLRGVLFVFAAGNESTNMDAASISLVFEGEDDEETELFGASKSYPAAFASELPNVIAVAASSARDGITNFSNYGRRSVDIAAPGEPILSTYRRAPVWDEFFLEDLENRWVSGGAHGGQWAWDPMYQDVTSNRFQMVIRCGPSGKPGESGSIQCKPEIVGSYRPSSNAWIQSLDPVDLTGRTGCKLYVGEAHGLQKFRDFLYFEGSTDNAIWTQIGRRTGTGFELDEFDLSGFNGRRFWLRVRLASDGRGGGFGVDIVNMYVDGCGEQDYQYEFLAGTSMAAPHVSGAAALLLARYPHADPQWMRRAINDGARRNTTWSTRVKSGGRLDLPGMFAAAGTLVAPLAFDLIEPGGAVQVVGPRPVFSWLASAADSGVASYELFVDGALARSVGGRELMAAATGSGLTPGAHTWHVVAADRDGDRTASETRRFQVVR